MSSLRLIESYYNDGYVYCLLTRIEDPNSKKQLVKIGKTKMKVEDDEIKVKKKLLSRYNTYYPDYDVLYFIRTGNCHKAERYIFKTLKCLHYKKELYLYDKKKLDKVFSIINKYFPNTQKQLLEFGLDKNETKGCVLDDHIQQITNTNVIIRCLEKT
jgi:hypothetical protein